MEYERLSRDELLHELKTLQAQWETSAARERLAHELEVHQVELELQNRELRDSQAALEESRSRYANLYDFAPVAYMTLDTRGVVQEINLTGATLLGKDRADIVGFGFLSLVRVDDAASFWAHLRRGAESRVPVVSELHLKTPRHGPIEVQIVSTPVLDPAGRAIAFRTSFTDITKRKEAEAVLARLAGDETRLRARFEKLDQVSVVLSTVLAQPRDVPTTALLDTFVSEARRILDAEYAAVGIGFDRAQSFTTWAASGVTPAQHVAIGAAPRPVGLLGEILRTGQTLRLPDVRVHPAFVGFPPNHPVMRSFLGTVIRFRGERLGALYVTNKQGADAFDDEDQHLAELLAVRVGVLMEVSRLQAEVQAAVQARDESLAQLAESEAHARRLIEDAPEPYFLRAVDGRYIDLNEAASTLLGYSREELLAMDGSVLVLPEDLPRLAATRAAQPPGTVSVNEWRLLRKTGELVDVETKTKILPDGRRQGFMRDITGRKEAERERARILELERRHAERLEALRESTLVISSIEHLTADGVRSVLQRVVDQARLLVGADYAAIGIGTDPDQAFDPWVWSGLSAEQAAAIGAPPHARGVLGWVARQGEPLRLHRLQAHHASGGVPVGHPLMQAFLGTPIIREGRSIGNLYLAKKPEREVFTPEDHTIVALLAGHAAIAIENARLYDERQAAVRVREEVIAVVSHDLKTPLSAIELRASLLARTQTDPDVVKQARSVRRSVAMMQRMIRGLLDGASLASGQLRLDIGAHDLGEVVDDVVEVLTPIASEREVKLEARIPALASLRFDRERLVQTVYNLAGNAVKFTPAGGSVVIEAVLRDDELEVSVTDTGTGIAPETLPRIFDRYFTTAKGHEGTGLGLYIAKGVIAAHGGRIWVDSTLGVGSSFYFTLPVVSPS